MSEGIKIALPGDASPEELKKLADAQAAGAPSQQVDLRALGAKQEGEQLEAEIEDTTNTDMLPYKEDAPACEDFSGTRAIARMTEHFEVVQMPAWTHGRCIGPSCARFKSVNGEPICGKALQDLAAAKELGMLKDEDVEVELARWAYPPTEAEGEADAAE
jgi:hypothetical protein